jgi:NAD(P)H-hydrate epimerase
MGATTIDQLPPCLYRAEQVRELDRIAIEEQGIPGFTLMRRAGQAAFQALINHYPEPSQISIFCGTGNNGGDGYVMAVLAKQRGIPVTVLQVGEVEKITGDALQARRLAEQDGIEILPFVPGSVVADGVVVDALLGTGLGGNVRGDFTEAVEFINNSGLPVLAVDIPSGLCSDTGRVLGQAVKASLTVTFIAAKQGLLTGQANDATGQLYFEDLAVPEAVYTSVPASSERLDLNRLLPGLLPRRSRCAHKGSYGHIMVAGGDKGMAGAAAMASQAATRVGAGLVSCATRPEHVAALVARCPEVMTQGVISGQEIEPLLDTPSVIVVGPGLGQGPWGEQLLQQVCAQDKPLVVDADALNILANGRVIQNPHRDNWILTPHPGEAARLLQCSTADINQDRFAAVVELQRRFGGAVILKGAGTLVATPDSSHPFVCPYGNPGMASGGMGDVLSGVLGALLAQGLGVADAACLGVCLHARAADEAAAAGERGLLATDLLPQLRALVNLA